MTIRTKRELAEAVQRELNLRCTHYPRWVREGKKKQADADRGIEDMRAMLRVIMALPDDFVHSSQQ